MWVYISLTSVYSRSLCYIRVMLGVSETACVIAGRCLGALAQTVAAISILTKMFHTHAQF